MTANSTLWRLILLASAAVLLTATLWAGGAAPFASARASVPLAATACLHPLL